MKSDIFRFTYSTPVLLIGVALSFGCKEPSPQVSLPPSGNANAKPTGSFESTQKETTDLKQNTLTKQSKETKPRQEFSSEPPADSGQLRVEAKRSVDDLVQLLPRNPDALEMKARIHLLLGENDAAKQAWEETINFAPNYGYAIYGLGGIALRSGDHATAIELLKKAVDLLPSNPDPSLDLAESYTKLGQIDEAIEALSASSKVNTNSSSTFLQLGQAYLTQRKFEEAKTAFEAALAISAELPKAQQGLGTALLRLGNRVEAEKLLQAQKSQRTTKNRSPEVVFTDEKKDISNRFELLSKIYLQNGNEEKAEEILMRSLVLDPSNALAGESLLKLYQSQRRLSDSLEASKRLCEIAPNNPDYQYTYGVFLQRNANPSLAAEAFQKVIELAPENPIGYESLIRILLLTRKQLDIALEYGQKLVKLRGNAMDNELLGQVYAVTGDLSMAKHHLEVAIELDPANESFLMAMKHLKKAIGDRNE